MTITLDGTTGITTPGLTNTGTETVVNLTTTGNTTLGDATTDTLTVGVTGIVKDASGNVGIGTASPSTKLDVSNGASASTYPIQARNSQTGSSDFVGIAFSTGTATDNSQIRAAIGKVQSGGSGILTFSTAAYGTTDLSTLIEQARIDSAGLFKFNSGYGSAATAYGCRAWVNFTGSTAAIKASGNVTSITRSGVGSYTINFTTAMPDINYSVSSTVTAGTCFINAALTTTSFVIGCSTFYGSSNIDPANTCVQVFR
jgi:hypothetical protein